MSTVIHQPCIYGLREKCEAIELCFRLLSGDVEEALKTFMTPQEPKTDEEKVVSKISGAIAKYMSNLYMGLRRESISSYFTETLSRLCEKCPHRLNAVKSIQPKETHEVAYPEPKPTGVT